MGLLALLLALGTALSITGCVLLVLGLRGRLIDDHPYCRKCHYDLTGRPDGSARCPECGADLGRPKAIKIGRRRRRPLLATVGLVLLLIAPLSGVAVALPAIRQFNPYPYYPMSWLVTELGSIRPTDRTDALKELTDRFNAGKYAKSPEYNPVHLVEPGQLPQTTTPQLGALADRLLAQQADRTRLWFKEQGDFLDYLFRTDRLDRARLERYVKQAVEFKVELRPVVRAGDPVVARTTPGGRAGSLLPMWLQFRTLASTTPLADDVEQYPGFEQGSYNGSGFPSGGGYSEGEANTLTSADGRAELGSGRLTGLSPGPLTVYVAVQWEMRFRPASEDPEIKPITRGVILSSHQIRVLPADAQDDVTPIPPQAGEDLAGAVRRSVRHVEVNHNVGVEVTSFTFDLSAPPEDLSYNVYAAASGEDPPRPVLVGTLTARAQVGSSIGFSTRLFPDGPPPRLDLTLTPSPDPARRTVDLFRYADVEVRLKDIPVTSQP